VEGKPQIPDLEKLGGFRNSLELRGFLGQFLRLEIGLSLSIAKEHQRIAKSASLMKPSGQV
jgi:hypothetical protein